MTQALAHHHLLPLPATFEILPFSSQVLSFDLPPIAPSYVAFAHVSSEI